MSETEGIGTTVSWTIIILVVIVLILAIPGTLYGETKNALEYSTDLTEIKKIYDDVFKSEKSVNLESSKKLIDYLKGKFGSEEIDCLVNLDLSGFSDEFIIQITDGDSLKVFEEEGNTERYVNLDHLDYKVYFSGGAQNFKILDLKEVEVFDTKHKLYRFILYKLTDRNIFFLDNNNIYDYEGLKPFCGDARLNINEGYEGNQELGDYLNEETKYNLQDYSIYQLLNYLAVLKDKLNNLNDDSKRIVESRIRDVSLALGNHLEEFNKDKLAPSASPGHCWEMVINDGLIRYGGLEGSNRLTYSSAAALLSNGRSLSMNLMVSKDGCLPATVIDELTEGYRVPQDFQQ